MKLVRFGEFQPEKPGIVTAREEIVDVSAVVLDYDADFFANGGIERLAEWLSFHEADAPRIEPGTRLGAPIARPSKIICVGLNYMDHVKETNAQVPEEPVLFSKAPSAQNGPFDPVEVPRHSTKLDWEVELAFVIGKRAKYVEEADALSHIAGYMVMNDLSERSFQNEHCGQWVKGKSHDTFAPMGPYLVTPDEIADVQNLPMYLDVNGERMQTGNTNTMIFGVRQLVSYISRFMTLMPGDVVSTGTPPGVGLGRRPQVFLKPGDVVELGIEGLGAQRQSCVAAV